MEAERVSHLSVFQIRILLSNSRTAGLFVVYAQKSEKSTLAICEQLRNSPETSAVPILLVISRYEINQGSAVKRMGNATFTITPFKEEELCDKIEQMKKEFNNHEPSGN